MNKELKGTILSLTVAILVVIVSVLSYHYLNKNIDYSKINEDVNVKTHITKENTVLNIDNQDYKLESYKIDVDTDKFYHFKIVLETSGGVSYEVYLDNKKVIDETYSSDKVITLYEGEFHNKKENYEIVIKSKDESPNNKISFVY